MKNIEFIKKVVCLAEEQIDNMYTYAEILNKKINVEFAEKIYLIIDHTINILNTFVKLNELGSKTQKTVDIYCKMLKSKLYDESIKQYSSLFTF